MAADKKTIAKYVVLFLSFAFTIGTIALFGSQTSNSSLCNGWKVLKATADGGGISYSLTCPWGTGVLIVAYFSLVVTLIFLFQVILRFKLKSLKLLRIRVISGFIATCLLLLTFIVMVSYLGHQDATPEGHTTSGVKYSYSRVPFRGNCALEFFTMLAVGAVAVYEIWTYRRNSKEASGEPATRSRIPAPPTSAKSQV